MKKLPKNNIDNDDEALDDLFSYMQQYTVEFPNEEEIDETIEVLRQYVPRKNKPLKNFCNLAKTAAGEIAYINKAYWIVCSILFLAGYWFSINSTNSYITIMALAPLPFILGIVEIFKARDSGVLEIEMTCKISAYEIMLSKILVMGIYSIFMNTVLSSVLCMFNSNINLLKLSIMWLTPLTLVSGISLFIAKKFKGDYTIAAIISTWSAVILYIYCNKKLLNYIVQLNVIVYLVILSISTLILALQIKALSNKHNNIFERRNEIEINA